MGGSNEEYEVNHQTYCGSMERWAFKPIYTTYIHGIYTLTNLDKDVQPANINGSEITLSANQGDQWVIEPAEDAPGEYTIRNAHSGNYLGAGSDLTVHVVPIAGETEQWTINTNNDGDFCIFNVEQ